KGFLQFRLRAFSRSVLRGAPGHCQQFPRPYHRLQIAPRNTSATPPFLLCSHPTRTQTQIQSASSFSCWSPSSSPPGFHAAGSARRAELDPTITAIRSQGMEVTMIRRRLKQTQSLEERLAEEDNRL